MQRVTTFGVICLGSVTAKLTTDVVDGLGVLTLVFRVVLGHEFFEFLVHLPLHVGMLLCQLVKLLSGDIELVQVLVLGLQVVSLVASLRCKRLRLADQAQHEGLVVLILSLADALLHEAVAFVHDVLAAKIKVVVQSSLLTVKLVLHKVDLHAHFLLKHSRSHHGLQVKVPDKGVT